MAKHSLKEDMNKLNGVIDTIYLNMLDIEQFSHVFDNTDKCYKFYWLKSILSFAMKGQFVITYDELMERMIAQAWYTVSEYHLHMGAGQGNAFEKAIDSLLEKIEEKDRIRNNAPEEEVVSFIHKHADLIRSEKNQLALNVPYHFLSPFIDENTLNRDVYRSEKSALAYFEKLSLQRNLPYAFVNGVGLNKKIILNEEWAKMLKDNQMIISGWIKAELAEYLQRRNPSVPGIILKLDPEMTDLRKLTHVRKIWNMVMEENEIWDIYKPDERLNDQKYDIDHFIPWSYVACDELWNLIPANKSVNISKSNYLPDWDKYIEPFIKNQFILNRMISSSEIIHREFERSKTDNLNSLWAQEELYCRERNEDEFSNILIKNMRPVYDNALMQGYTKWLY